MANTNNNINPNARFNTGQNMAGGGRISVNATLQAASPTGLDTAGTVANGQLWTGFSAAGTSRNNPGPNVAGAPRSVNNN